MYQERVVAPAVVSMLMMIVAVVFRRDVAEATNYVVGDGPNGEYKWSVIENTPYYPESDPNIKFTVKDALVFIYDPDVASVVKVKSVSWYDDCSNMTSDATYYTSGNDTIQLSLGWNNFFNNKSYDACHTCGMKVHAYVAAEA